MTTAADNKVVGTAVYFEFVKGTDTSSTMTQQILLMPEGMTPSGRTISMTMFRRRLTVHSPRKTWRQNASPVTLAHSIVAHGTPPADFIDSAVGLVIPLMSQLRTHNWKPYREPIFVEVTAEDLELARLGKTPYKTLGRVWKVRKKRGFPKEYLHRTDSAI